MKWTDKERQIIWDLRKKYYTFYYILGRPSDRDAKLLGLTVNEVMFRKMEYTGEATTAFNEINKIRKIAKTMLGRELTEVFFPILDFMSRDQFREYEGIKNKYKINGYNSNVYSYMCNNDYNLKCLISRAIYKLKQLNNFK